MFGDNQRISGIQMERQFLLTYLGPVMLWIAPGLPGRYGIFGIATGVLVLGIWVFFLMRQSHVLRYPERYWGKYMGWVVKLIFESYLILTGGWLAASTGKILRQYMIQGIPDWFIVALIVLTALAGNTTLQVRGRFAQTVWPVAGSFVFLMLLLAAFQGQGGYGQEVQTQQLIEYGGQLMMQETPIWNQSGFSRIGRNLVLFIACLSGVVFLPFVKMELHTGSNYDSQTGIIFRIIGKTGLWTGAVILLLQAVYGDAGAEFLDYPVLNMMAGVRIPGGFVRRIDMIFLAVILFILLFALGSIFFYSQYIFKEINEQSEKGLIRKIPAAVLCFLLGTVDFGGWSPIQDYMGIVTCIYLPLFLALTCCNALLRRRQYGKQKEQE